VNIQKLKNPKTQSYQSFKEFILSDQFFWYWNSVSLPLAPQYDATLYKNVPFYSHTFLERPETTVSKIPRMLCPNYEAACTVLLEILSYNKVSVNSFLRINANCVHPENEVVNTVPHTDHHYTHNNVILYLTNAGGEIVVNGEAHNPKEDDVILFGGLEHYIRTPKKDRRIILIATFF